MFVLTHHQTELGQFNDKKEAFKSAHSLGHIPLVLAKKGFAPSIDSVPRKTFWQLKLVTNRIPETTPYTLDDSGRFCEIEKPLLPQYHDVFEFCGAKNDGQDPTFWLELLNDRALQNMTDYDFGVGAGENIALFLDRDGVLIHDTDYPRDVKQLKIREEIIPVLIAAQKQNYKLIVVTNQSGVARGYFDIKTVDEIHHYLQCEFSARGVNLTHWYFCPYHQTGEESHYQKISHYRKPYPGMFLQAAAQYHINFQQSLMIGDKLSDQPLALNLKTYFIHDPAKSKDVAAGFYGDFPSLLKDLPF
jgi:D-glycero-D-manno-heptose 1,7-bisphosphate phosphatase